jgi:AbrB family looped-hinge helix DNA binding protein
LTEGITLGIIGNTTKALEARHQLPTSQLTRKGQVTIPAEVRRHLGLKQGDRVAFVQEGDTVTVWPATSVSERTAGALRQYRRTPTPTPAEEHEAFAQAVADEVGESLGG